MAKTEFEFETYLFSSYWLGEVANYPASAPMSQEVNTPSLPPPFACPFYCKLNKYYLRNLNPGPCSLREVV